jgi:endoglucanase
MKKINRILLIVIALTIVMMSCKNSKQEFVIKRGTNLSHWLSQDFGWAPKYTYINENDIKTIDSLGFDHVRIPIDEFEIWDSLGQPIPQAFKSLTSCIGWCEKYGLRVILDLHVLRAHHFNAANEGKSNTLWTDSLPQQNFVNLWIKLSDSLHQYSTSLLAYELLNEAVAPSHDDWNKLFNMALTKLREIEPNRVIIIGSNMWQTPDNIQFLKLPENDKNIILSFHTYSPMLFTHYKANWTSFKTFNGKVQYPGQVISTEDGKNYKDTTKADVAFVVKEGLETWSKERIASGFKSAIEFAKAKKLQLICGEFGCLPNAERKDRLQYYSDIIDVFEENGIAWCNWEYKGDFGLYYFDSKNQKSLQLDNEFVSVLLKHLKK